VTAVLQGHVVEEARARAWDTLPNGELLDAAEAAAFDVFVARDRNFRYQQNRGCKYFSDRLSIETHMGMAVDIDATFRALADPTRRRAIERLCAGPASMTELLRPLRITLPSLSKHLDIIEASGIVRSTKTGRVRTYRLVPGKLAVAEHWLARQRTLWEQRLDQLDNHLKALEGEHT